MDLFWMPVVEFRKEDGHPVKGLQKGFSSFGLNSAAGIVGMAQTLVGLVQVKRAWSVFFTKMIGFVENFLNSVWRANNADGKKE